jgi:mediator of RNA polymerase II transcription subunit 16
MAANGLSMDLGSAMDVDVSDLDVSVGNALNGMDGQMPLTDLFGDPLDIQEMPRAAASKQLQQRLDELRTRGCCQYVSSVLPPSTCRID